nr:melibiose:sodium transporter MelB [uncultured Anaerostipes sp.]
MEQQTNKVPGRVKYTFAFGALGKDLIYGMMATFSMIYFTDVLKVSPGFVGMVFFVAKLWDAFNDLFMGMIVDNTRSRWGKFIPWLVIGTLVNSIVFVTLFTDFHLTGTTLCIFVAVIYVLWGMTYTIMDIPYWSVIPNLTSDPHEREVVSVLPRIFASIGQSLIIAGFGVQIIAALGGGYIGYHRFAVMIAGTFIFTIGVAVVNLKVKEDHAPKAKISFRGVFSIIKQNDQLQSAVGLILLYNVGIQFIMGVAVYYFTYVCGNANMLSAFMISASIAEVVGLIIFPKVAKNLSRKTSFLLACILPFIGLALLLIVGFVSPENILLTAISGIIVKTGTGLELGCATVFLADVVDYGEYKLKTRNESVVFSLQTLIVKFTAALTSLFIGFALERTGYIPDANAVQSALTLNSIRFLMCAIPAVSMLAAYVVYKKSYKLNDSYMKNVIEVISKRRTENQGKENEEHGKQYDPAHGTV